MGKGCAGGEGGSQAGKSAALFPPPGNLYKTQRTEVGNRMRRGDVLPGTNPQRLGALERSTRFLDPLGVRSQCWLPLLPHPGPGCCLPAQGVQLTPAFSEACFIFNFFQKKNASLRKIPEQQKSL